MSEPELWAWVALAGTACALVAIVALSDWADRRHARKRWAKLGED